MSSALSMGATLKLCCCGGCCKYGCCCCADDDIELENAGNLSRLTIDSKGWKTGDIILERFMIIQKSFHLEID